MTSQGNDWRTRFIGEFNSSPIVKTLGHHLDKIGEGWAITKLVARQKHIHSGGLVQGGVLLVMADAAFTAALYSTQKPGEDSMITDMTINFVRPTQPGGHLEARATVIYRGNRVGFGEVDVLNDDRVLVAKCLGSAIYRPRLS